MCGFLVQFLFANGSLDDASLRARLERLTRRGPDQRNLWMNSRIWMGHQRLVLLGGEESGKQPLVNEVGDALAYNGEIYNFKELQSKYLTTNYLCDSEVLFALLNKIGAPILRELRGMFSFVYYEARTNEILLARDPFGMKPLFYRKLVDRWEFCSELRGFDDIRPDSVQAEIFHYHMAPLPGKSLYREIFELRPGSFAQIRDTRLNFKHYVTLGSIFNQARKPSREISETVRIDEFSELLRETVSMHMLADQSPGLILSGGVDSGCLALSLKDQSPSTYTMSVPELDESQSAASLAHDLNFQHQIFYPESIFEIESVLTAMDGPMGDASFFPTYDLFSQLKSLQKAVLGGDGGDEIFYGYPTFEVEALIRRCPRMIIALLQKIGLYCGRYSDLRIDFREKLLRFGWGHSNMPMMRQMQFMAAKPFNKLSSTALFEIQSNFSETIELEGIDPTCHWSQIFTYYFRYYLATQVLVKSDRASMAHSVELRCPYLDWQFFSKIFRFPGDGFPIFSSRKQVLRNYFSRNRTLKNFHKRGFSAPLHLLLPKLETVIAQSRGRGERDLRGLTAQSGIGFHALYLELIYEYFHGTLDLEHC